MNEPSNRLNLNQRQGEEVDTTQRQRDAAAPLEFATAEDLLRHDAAQVEVPGPIAGRLEKSVKQEPAASPWWKRLLNG